MKLIAIDNRMYLFYYINRPGKTRDGSIELHVPKVKTTFRIETFP